MLSDGDIIALRDKFSELFRFLGDRTAFHFMMGIGLPVLKPDRVIERIFKRLAIVDQGLEGDALYAALIRAGQRFAEATGYPIRYIDIIFVAYGQVQTDELGLKRGICLKEPLCSICGVTKYCDYYAQRRNPL